MSLVDDEREKKWLTDVNDDPKGPLLISLS